MKMESLMAAAEAWLKKVAVDRHHALEPFVLRLSGEVGEETWKRSVCVNCGMLWDARCSPGLDYFWGVATLEKPNRKSSPDRKGDLPEPVAMSFNGLPPLCEDVENSGYGVWLFDLG